MKKILFSAIVLAGMVASCTNEEFENLNSNDVVKNRTQINLTLTGENAETRFIPNGLNLGYENSDGLGAVLVDKGVKDKNGTNVVDWGIVASHVGNNKWTWNESKSTFTTNGTTSIGAWMFYSRYNSDMTTNRNGVEYTFPQIQEYAQDFEWIANNNVNFVVSPIYRVDGFEGENVEIPVKQASINSYVKLNLQLPTTVSQVQKIILTAKDGADADVKFPTKGRIVNTQMPVANMLTDTENLSYDAAYALPGNLPSTVAERKEEESARAYAELVNKRGSNYDIDLATENDANLNSKFKVVTEAVGNNTADFLVLDCVSGHTDQKADGVAVTGGKFMSYMAIPAGIYKSITLYVYTDKGIYKKEIAERDAAIDGSAPDKLASGKKNIVLKRQTRVNLANLTKAASEVEDAVIKVEEAKTAAEVATDLGGVVVTKTADLIAAIEGATDKSINFLVVNQPIQNLGADTPVPAHESIINKAVAGAVLTKWADARTNVTLNFLNQRMTIEGEEEPFDLVGMKFTKGATLISGKVNLAERIFFENNDDKFIVNSGATANFTKGSNASAQSFAVTSNSEIENNGIVNFVGYADITTLTNNGTVTVGTSEVAAGLKTTTITNNSSFTVNKGEWETGALTNATSASISNSGSVDVTGISTNSGSINNNTDAVINVVNTFTNSGTITNDVKAKIISGKAGAGTTGNLTNNKTVTNYGEMYCLNGNHTIKNVGTIEAIDKEENGTKISISRTYITENSSVNESSVTANSDVTRGEIKISHRDIDMTVAKKAFQGRISWLVPSNMSALTHNSEDKFNMIYLDASCDLSDYTNANVNHIKYVTVNENATLPKVTLTSPLVEFVANEDVTLRVDKKAIAILNIAEGKTLTVPTNNIVGVYDVEETGVVKALAEIVNKGTMLVGGKCFSSITAYPDGVFASGSGNVDEAYFWSQSANTYN